MSQKVNLRPAETFRRELLWDNFRQGNSRHPCPKCDKGPSDRALSVTVLGDKAVAYCFRCQYRESSGGTIRFGSGESITSPKKSATLSDYWRAVWNGCYPISGIAREYLLARNCFIPPADGDLRWHPGIKHRSGYVGAALVGRITDVMTCEPISLHLTWIRRDGTKGVENAKHYIANHRKQGGVVRLWPDESVHSGLATGEGIESVLSFAHAFQPAWACLDSGNLGAFPVLPGIAALAIAADNDEAGRRAAENCARRWIEADREVRIILPAHAGNDLNDVAGSE